MICQGKTVAEIVAIGNNWLTRIHYLQPKNIVELGTGQGVSGAQIMSALAPDAIFTTVNYADGHVFGEQLASWSSDPRLHRLDTDTLDPGTVGLVPDGVDLLFIDTTHEAWHAAEELCMWQGKLQDGAIVLVDDLNQHDMIVFWDSIPYEKSPYPGGSCQGVFRYDATKPYTAKFSLPSKTTY